MDRIVIGFESILCIKLICAIKYTQNKNSNELDINYELNDHNRAWLDENDIHINTKLIRNYIITIRFYVNKNNNWLIILLHEIIHKKE